MKVHYPKLYNMTHLFTFNVFTDSKGSNNYILFAITAAGVVPCGGPKKSPRTSSIVRPRNFSEDLLVLWGEL